MEPLKIIIHENCGASYEVAHTNYAPFSVPPRKPDDCVQQIPPRKSDDYEQQIPPRKSDDCVQQIPPQKSDDYVQQIPPIRAASKTKAIIVQKVFLPTLVAVVLILVVLIFQIPTLLYYTDPPLIDNLPLEGFNLENCSVSL